MSNQLRPRQQKAIADVRAAYSSGRRAPILCAPTGAGKTFTAAEIIRSAVAKGNRVWFLAHLKEILDDTCSRLERAGIVYGKIMAGARSEPHRDVQVVSVQTAVRRNDLKRPDLIIVDECHLAVASTYRAVFEMCGNPLLLGLTGTPCRLDGRGLGEMFDCIVPTCSTGDLIEEGLLAPIKYYAPSRPDLTAVHMRAGDYARDELEDAVDQPMITGDAVKHYRKMCHNRPAVAFCVSVKHAEHVAASFRAAGYRAIAVSGESSKQERKDALDGLRSGSIDVVCNAQLWVAGVDVPGIECIILLRPTKSLTFYLQAIGRGLRLAPGKQHCTVLDHAGCVFEHGMPDVQREWSLEGRKKKKKSDAPAVKQCPMCFGVHEPAPACPMCGHIYTTVARNGPQQVDGELVEFTMREAAALERAQVKDKQKEQASARTLPELEAIARQRGYKPGWAKRVMAAREAKRAAASGILR
jgi:superfamily II DNA or RNA helicase